MRIITTSIILMLLSAAPDSIAQKQTLPDSIVWNLAPQEREEFNVRDYSFADIDESVWVRPAKLSVKLVPLKPSDLGFGYGFNVEDFVKEAEKRYGALPCPEWVPIQLFMRIDWNKGEALWIPTTRTASGRGEMARLGKNRSVDSNADTNRSLRTDLFSGNPKGSKPSSTWVFMLP